MCGVIRLNRGLTTRRSVCGAAEGKVVAAGLNRGLEPLPQLARYGQA